MPADDAPSGGLWPRRRHHLSRIGPIGSSSSSTATAMDSQRRGEPCSVRRCAGFLGELTAMGGRGVADVECISSRRGRWSTSLWPPCDGLRGQPRATTAIYRLRLITPTARGRRRDAPAGRSPWVRCDPADRRGSRRPRGTALGHPCTLRLRPARFACEAAPTSGRAGGRHVSVPPRRRTPGDLPIATCIRTRAFRNLGGAGFPVRGSKPSGPGCCGSPTPATRPDTVGRSWFSPSSAEDDGPGTPTAPGSTWSAGGGEQLLFDFDPATMQASRIGKRQESRRRPSC